MKKGLLIIGLVMGLLTACNNYGEKLTFGKGELYYTKNVTEVEAQKAGAALQEMKYFADDKAVSVQLDKHDSTYNLRFVVNEKAFTDSTSDLSFKVMSILVSAALENKEVVVEMCDKTFTPKRTIK